MIDCQMCGKANALVYDSASDCMFCSEDCKNTFDEQYSAMMKDKDLFKLERMERWARTEAPEHLEAILRAKSQRDKLEEQIKENKE